MYKVKLIYFEIIYDLIDWHYANITTSRKWTASSYGLRDMAKIYTKV